MFLKAIEDASGKARAESIATRRWANGRSREGMIADRAVTSPVTGRFHRYLATW
jgi:hypothetical protein